MARRDPDEDRHYYPTPYEVLVTGTFQLAGVLFSYMPASRLALSPDDVRAVEREWRRARNRARRDGARLFSGRLLRVEEYSLDPTGRLSLRLGITTYKQYVGTRARDFFVGRPRESLANPLAACAVVVTADGFVVVARREGVDVAVGQYDVPGGFLEPGLDPNPFCGIAREVSEELGLSPAATEFTCLGLVYDRLHPHYELCFAGRVAVPFAELSRLPRLEVETGPLEPLRDSPNGVTVFLKHHRGRMSPTGEACLELYSRLRSSLGW